MLSYKASFVPADTPNRTWFVTEFQNIFKAANRANDVAMLRTLNAAPAKTNDGDVRLADGVNWNPRFGQQQLYLYSLVDAEWKGLVHVGLGGAVTQGAGAGKATGVTLNTDTGEITLDPANLAAATTVSFVLTNSRVKASDVLILNHVSGGTLGVYLLNPSCALGAATLYITNTTAGALAEAIVIRFTRIPGAVA